MKASMIEEIVLRHEQSVTGELGFAFCDLETGEEFFRNRDHACPTASTFKVFLLAELFHQAEEGRFHMEDRIVLKESDKREGSGILDELHEGASLTLWDYAYLMMSLSDNTATDILFRLVGQENIQKNVLERYELKNSKCDWDCKTLIEECFRVTGGTYNRTFSYQNLPHFVCQTEKNDQTTPEDMLKLLKLMAQGNLISPYVSKNMMAIMEKCQMNHRIPRGLPDEAVVAHKTGTLDRITNDVGIVTSPHGSYALVFYYNGNKATPEEYAKNGGHQVGDQLIAGISRDIYQAYAGRLN